MNTYIKSISEDENIIDSNFLSTLSALSVTNNIKGANTRRESFINFLNDCSALEKKCLSDSFCSNEPSLISQVKEHARNSKPIISRTGSIQQLKPIKKTNNCYAKSQQIFNCKSQNIIDLTPYTENSIFTKDKITWAITKTVPIISQAAATAANVAQSVGTIIGQAIAQSEKLNPAISEQPSSLNLYKQNLTILTSFHKSDIHLFQRLFQTCYWVEPPIKPIKEKFDNQNKNCSKVWQIIEPYANQESKNNHLNKVFRKGCNVVTRQKWHHLLPDISKEMWNFAHVSHLELSIFSVENVPYISQIVIESKQLRIALPFNCMFIRIPVTEENEVITLWFNSPVTTSQRHERLDPEDSYYDWLDAEEPAGFISIDEDIYTEEQLQELTDMHIHPNSQLYYTAPQGVYTPKNDFPLFFKFQIPVLSSLQLEKSALIDPKNCFYECNSEQWPQTNFIRLLSGTRQSGRQPIIKFRASLNFQGPHKLIRSNQNRSAYPNPNEPYYKQELVYTALYNDPVDQLVSLELNRNEYELMKVLGEKGISRVKPSYYSIYGREVEVIETIINTKLYPEFNFSIYPHINGKMFYLNKFILPVVIYDGLMQPLPDYVMKTNLNNRFLESKVYADSNELEGFNSQFIPDLDLRDEIFPLPFEALKNPEVVCTLYRHARAIKKNLIRMFTWNQINPLTEKDAANLQPPLVQLDPNSMDRKPVTFSWNIYDVKSGIELVPVNTSKNQYGGIFYLNPNGHIPTSLRAAYNIRGPENHSSETFKNVVYNVTVPHNSTAIR